MSQLISNAALQSLRNLAILGMQTTVTIKRLTTTENAVGEVQTWPAVTTLKGWLHSNPVNTMVLSGGAQEVVPMYRLFLPVGTDVRHGDRVAIGGEDYTVFDTDAESTWLPMLTVTMRKGE